MVGVLERAREAVGGAVSSATSAATSGFNVDDLVSRVTSPIKGEITSATDRVLSEGSAAVKKIGDEELAKLEYFFDDRLQTVARGLAIGGVGGYYGAIVTDQPVVAFTAVGALVGLYVAIKWHRKATQ